jgi:DNA-binding XRE family transcriptional regulator
MFRNLEAEQARNGYTNQYVADFLGISRTSYENKKKSGKFTTREIKLLCKLFKCKFDYLFEDEEERMLATIE